MSRVPHMRARAAEQLPAIVDRISFMIEVMEGASVNRKTTFREELLPLQKIINDAMKS